MTPICALPSTPDFFMISMDHTNRAPGEFCFLIILHHNLTIKTGLLLEHSYYCPLRSLLVQVLCRFYELPPHLRVATAKIPRYGMSGSDESVSSKSIKELLTGEIILPGLRSPVPRLLSSVGTRSVPHPPLTC